MQKHQRPVLLIPNRCNWSMILLCFIDQFNCRVFVTWWSWLLRLNCFSLNWIDSTLNFPFRSHVLTTLNIIVVQQHLMMLKVTLFLTSNKKHFQRDYCVRLHQLVHEFNLLNLPYHDLDRRTDGRLHFTKHHDPPPDGWKSLSMSVISFFGTYAKLSSSMTETIRRLVRTRRLFRLLWTLSADQFISFLCPRRFNLLWWCIIDNDRYTRQWEYWNVTEVSPISISSTSDNLPLTEDHFQQSALTLSCQ